LEVIYKFYPVEERRRTVKYEEAENSYRDGDLDFELSQRRANIRTGIMVTSNVKEEIKLQWHRWKRSEQIKVMTLPLGSIRSFVPRSCFCFEFSIWVQKERSF